MRAEFEGPKQQWLTPELFKPECKGNRMTALCAKCYYVEEPDSESSTRRVCPRDRIASIGGVLKRRSTAVFTEQKTEDFAWFAVEFGVADSHF